MTTCTTVLKPPVPYVYLNIESRFEMYWIAQKMWKIENTPNFHLNFCVNCWVVYVRATPFNVDLMRNTISSSPRRFAKIFSSWHVSLELWCLYWMKYTYNSSTSSTSVRFEFHRFFSVYVSWCIFMVCISRSFKSLCTSADFPPCERMQMISNAAHRDEPARKRWNNEYGIVPLQAARLLIYSTRAELDKNIRDHRFTLV